MAWATVDSEHSCIVQACCQANSQGQLQPWLGLLGTQRRHHEHHIHNRQGNRMMGEFGIEFKFPTDIASTNQKNYSLQWGSLPL